jgi:hypothetical protein
VPGIAVPGIAVPGIGVPGIAVPGIGGAADVREPVCLPLVDIQWLSFEVAHRLDYLAQLNDCHK